MKFYVLSYTLQTVNEKAEIAKTDHKEWFTSERSAVIRRQELSKAGLIRRNESPITYFDIQPRHHELCAFLNKVAK